MFVFIVPLQNVNEDLVHFEAAWTVDMKDKIKKGNVYIFKERLFTYL